jgi:hypothetical protein
MSGRTVPAVLVKLAMAILFKTRAYGLSSASETLLFVALITFVVLHLNLPHTEQPHDHGAA